MSQPAGCETWSAAASYEEYMGRWSREVAQRFLDWLAPPSGADWLDVGCGTGALSQAILTQVAPRSLLGIDPSPDFVAQARGTVLDSRVRFAVAGAELLPTQDASIDAVGSGLVLNFVPDRTAALAEIVRVLRPGGLLGFYVWDYPGGGLGFMKAFWQAVLDVDPSSANREQSARSQFCTPEGLSALCRDAGFPEPEVTPIEIVTPFPDFEAFWRPFTLGAGPGGGFLAKQSPAQRERIKARLAETYGDKAPIILPARAWAVKANRP